MLAMIYFERELENTIYNNIQKNKILKAESNQESERLVYFKQQHIAENSKEYLDK
jgi:hypothetical protein